MSETNTKRPRNPKSLAVARLWKLNNKERVKAWQDKHNAKIMADPELRKAKNLAQRKSRLKRAEKYSAYDKARDKLKVRARQSVRDRVRRGTIKRLPCEVCGDVNSQAHHKDYAKPLDVVWLCQLHHQEEHKKEKTNE